MSQGPPDGSLAGIVAAATAVGHVDGLRGIALVRGYPLPDLARHCTYEEVARLVIHGELPSRAELAAFRAELDEGAKTARRAPAPPGGRASFPESLVACVATSGDGPPANTVPEHLLARIPDACATAAGLPAPPPELPYAARALRALGAKRTDDAAARALEVLLILESEHGLSASTFAARVAASSGASLPASLAAATATLGGARHGGATREAHAFLSAAIASGDVRGFAAGYGRGPLPGFGHRVYKVPDPRAPPLKEAMASLGSVPLQAAADAVEDAVRPRLGPKGVHANVDFHAAVLLDALGIAPDLFVAAFALGIACGWIAHAREQAASGRLVRPDSLYVGAATRAVPRT